MIKKIFRSLIINLFSLYLLPSVVTTVSFENGITTILIAAATLTVANIIAKPLVKLVMLPVNLITLGTLSWLSGVFVLYLTLYLIPDFSVSPFSFSGGEYQGFVIPAYDFNLFWTIVLISLFINAIYFVFGLIFDI